MDILWEKMTFYKSCETSIKSGQKFDTVEEGIEVNIRQYQRFVGELIYPTLVLTSLF